MFSRTTWRRALALAITTVVACHLESRTALSGDEAVRVDVSPKLVILQQNQSADFTAIGFTSTGDTADVTINWSATSGSITDTSSSSGRHRGRYRAGADTGKVKVVARGRSGRPADTAVVTVTLAPVTAVAVNPAAASVAVGQIVQLAATPQDLDGNPLVGRVVTWSSTNPGVATVSGSGVVSGVAAGAATVSAACEGQSGAAAITVTVVPVASVAVSPASATVTVGQTIPLTATPKDANGNPLSGRTVTWATSNAAVASVSGNGLVTGGAAGTATITASSEGQNGTAAITVTAAIVPVASVSLSPASTSLVVGQTAQLAVTTKDSAGNVLTGRTITWASSSTTVATVSASGLVTAKAAGSATITATSEGKSGTATITVTIAPVASVTVSPASVSVAVGQTVQLTATPKDANGNPLTGRVVTWATSNAAVATVDGSGLATGVAVGSATITATSEGKNGSAALTVTLLPPPGCAARCHYVDAVAGNDANAGTSTSPWRTIQHAADVLNPGDTAIVNDGVYTGGSNVVTISRSGTPTAWLVFRAANRWGAKVDGQNFSSMLGFEISGNYIRVEGFEVLNSNRAGIEAYGGREDIAGNHDIIITQNHVHDIGHICTSSSGGMVGVNAYSDNMIIERNAIHDIGRLMPGQQGCNPSNTYWQSHDHGIYNGVGNNVVIRNNVFYNIAQGWAIQRYNGAGTVTTGLTIVNNTFVFPNPWRDAQIIIATATNNIVIANNVFYQPTTAGVWFDGFGDGATVVGNVSTTALQTGGSGLTMSGNLQNTDPRFVDATGFDFHLTAGSPARGLGVPAWCPAIDFDGVARTGGCSVGAYQN